jgi:ABC-2 type transport system permease protein
MSPGPAAALHHSRTWVEARLPWTSDRVSGVAAAGLRSWLRAPEMKMTMLAPVFMLVVFSRMFASRDGASPELLRPLTTAGLAAFMLIFGMVGPVGNQFAYDRGGFRAYVLSPASRRDLLMGKNLALLPFSIAMMVVVVALSQWFNPMRLDHFIGVLFQLVPMYLVFCLAGNVLSIVSPIALKPGSGMPAPHQGLRGLFSFLFVLVVPVPLALTLMPLGIEALFRAMHWLPWFPVYLVLSIIQAIVAVCLYRRVLDWEGRLLQRRELQILDVVGSRAE